MELWSNIKRAFFARFLILRATAHKRIGFGEALRLMLPGRFLSGEMLLRKQVVLGDAIKERLHMLPDGGVLMFGKPFYPLQNNYWNLYLGFKDIIDEDGYQAQKFFKKDSIIIDAGASGGYFTIFAAHLAPQGKIYAFEPVPDSYNTLMKNMKSYANVVCVPKGLGKETTTAEMRWTDIGHGNAAVLDSPHLEGRGEFGGHIKVSITTIDDFVRENKILRVDFIKMDTEGYERFILEGAKETLRKWKPVLSLSAYHHPDDRTEIPRIIREINPSYRATLYEDKDELRFLAS